METKEKTEIVQVKKNEEEMEIDLFELMLYYKSRLVFVIGGFLIGAILMALVTIYLVAPKYTATAKLYMVSSSSDSIVNLSDLDLGTSLSSDYEELLRVRPILEEVIKKEKLPYTYEQLLNMLTISTVSDTRILSISAESKKPDEAKRIVNRLATLAVTELPKLMDTSKPNIAENAIMPKKKSSPSLFKNTMLGAIVGLVTFFFMTDDTMKSAEDVEKEFGIMPLTVIPEGDVASISDEREKEIYKNKKKRRKEKKK